MRPFLCAVCLLIAVVLGINGAAAWDKERHEARLRRLAHDFRPGLAMVFAGYVDERRLQKARVASIPRPRVVAFGSSRIRELSTPTVGVSAGEFYNAGMSAASVEDHIAVWSLLKRDGKIPELAVFSLDAWLFNGSHEQVRWLALSDTVSRFLEGSGGGAGMTLLPLERAMYGWYRAKEFLSFTVLRTSTEDLDRLVRGRRLGERVAEAFARDLVPESAVAGRNAIRADGSVMRAEGRPSATQLRQAARRYATSGESHLGGFRWDATRAERLERLWQDMRAAHVEIVAYMPPYHPTTWELLRSDRNQAAAITSTSAFLRELSARQGVRFSDASDPATVPCDEASFYDAEHADPACLARLIAGLRR